MLVGFIKDFKTMAVFILETSWTSGRIRRVYFKCDEYKNEMNLTDAFCCKIQFENTQK